VQLRGSAASYSQAAFHARTAAYSEPAPSPRRREIVGSVTYTARLTVSPVDASMRTRSTTAAVTAALAALNSPLPASAAGPVSQEVEMLVVSATKLPSDLESLPASVTVVNGDEARSRGARDLRTALSLVAGVDIAPGGDAGPAGAVPALWGLREFDAFLLVVDGIPYGGTFNPALATLTLDDVERIEVLRGPAPVMYGATSFVGVIYVVRYAAGETPTRVDLAGGTPGTGLATLTTNLPQLGSLRQSISLSGETRDYSQDRSGVERGHLLYRAAADTGLGLVQFDVDATALRQDPYSPHPREGGGLSPRFPLDANVNPTDARQDQDRVQANLRLAHSLGSGQWITTASYAYTSARNTRGFLREDFATDGVTSNADGFRQDVHTTDLYFDSYFAPEPAGRVSWLIGLDWMYGNGSQQSSNFEYAVLPDGSNAPDSHDLPIDESTRLNDRRSFGGLYAQADWRVTDRWLVQAGLRLNLTDEHRDGRVVDNHAPPGTPPEKAGDSQSNTRASGVLGTSYRLWGAAGNSVTAFADYRDTFKPAAVDFGPEAEGRILEPETATAWEAGLKGRHSDGRIDWEMSYFDMDFNNLVIRENVAGLPALANAGGERFRGFEAEVNYHIAPDLRIAATYAHHDATFTDYARLTPDGSLQQLKGNTLELSPNDLAAAGIVYSPSQGFEASAVANYVGSRYLNKGNTAVADAYVVLDAGVGYRFGQWRVRVDGYNLTDERDPVAESEIGDAQFYTLPGRTVLLSVTFNP
jgi:outer membrane receptor protein involved in Fe transport